MDCKQIRASLYAVVEESFDIVKRAYDVAHLLLKARRACRHGSTATVDDLLVEALAQHQILLCEVSAMLRRAQAIIGKIPTDEITKESMNPAQERHVEKHSS